MMHAGNRAIRSEEARLLYVAMTRAKERLIMLAAPRSLPSSRRQWSLPQGDYAAGSASSMMDWVGNALWPALNEDNDLVWTAPGGSVWDIRWRTADSFVLPAPPPAHVRLPWPDPPTTPTPFVPLPKVQVALQKISVTALMESARAVAAPSDPVAPVTSARLPRRSAGCAASQRAAERFGRVCIRVPLLRFQPGIAQYSTEGKKCRKAARGGPLL